MTETRAKHPELLPAADVAALITLPTVNASVAGAVATQTTIKAPSLRIPMLTDLPVAAVVPEGSEYPMSTAGFGEVVVIPPKIGVADDVTREFANDSDPAATTVFANSLAASLAIRVDRGFLGTEPVVGLPGLEQIPATVIDAGKNWLNLDALIDGMAAAEAAGTSIDSWIMNPADKTALRKIKVTAGSVQTLISPDQQSANVTTVLGVPIYATPHCPAGTIYGVPRNRVHLVIREAAEVLTDSSLFFLSDRIAIKASVRIGWVVTDPKAVARIKITA